MKSADLPWEQIGTEVTCAQSAGERIGKPIERRIQTTSINQTRSRDILPEAKKLAAQYVERDCLRRAAGAQTWKDREHLQNNRAQVDNRLL